MLDRRAHVLLKIAAPELVDALRCDGVNKSMGLRVELAERAQWDRKEGHLQAVRQSIVLVMLFVTSTFQSLRVARENVVDDRHIDEHLPER